MTVFNTHQREVPLHYILDFSSFVNKKYSQTQAWVKITVSSFGLTLFLFD